MKQIFRIIAACFAITEVQAQVPVPPAEVQIRMALLAAPEEKRPSATVMGYTEKGDLVVLRQGTGDMICLADDPRQKGFSSSCYHKDLEPFMKRGRELRASGKNMQELTTIRDNEAKAGKIALVKQPATLFAFSAKDEDCDWKNGTVSNGYLRYVIYVPYATAESTGLPLKQGAPGMPWIMDPGTPRAHIMINPPANKQ